MTNVIPKISFSEGETFRVDAMLVDEDGFPLDLSDLSGLTIEWGISVTSAASPPPALLVSNTTGHITVDGDPIGGRVNVRVNPADHTAIIAGDWFHQCRTVRTDGTTIEQFEGPFLATQSIFV